MISYIEFHTISLGSIQLQVWGMWVALGIGTASLLLWKKGKDRMEKELHLDLVLWLLVGGFLGARLAHVFLYEPGFYLAHPVEMVKIWHGGLSSFGGFAGAGIALFLFFKKKKIARETWLALSDRFAFPTLVGWMIARMGCFFIHDHWGRQSNCPLAIAAPDGSRLDMALLEILGLLPLLIVFLVFRKKKLPDGFWISLLLIYYGVLRFILDFWRATDIANADTRYLHLTPAQFLSIVMVCFGVFLSYKQIKQNKQGKPSSAKATAGKTINYKQ